MTKGRSLVRSKAMATNLGDTPRPKRRSLSACSYPHHRAKLSAFCNS
jgi:hypothetical protein